MHGKSQTIKEKSRTIQDSQCNPILQDEPEFGTITIRILESRNFSQDNCRMRAQFGKERYSFKTYVNDEGRQFQIVSMPMTEPVPREVIIEVTDAERSRHEFNGKICIDTEQLIENGRLENIWAPLENCDSGEMLIAADVFGTDPGNVLTKSKNAEKRGPENQISVSTPIDKDATLFLGGISKLSLVKAKDLSKKDIFSKSDPYAVISYGSSKLKTHTIKNSHEPEWNYEFEIEETSDKGTDIVLQIFNKKTLAKDDSLGIVTFSSKELFHHMRIMSKWFQLEDTKSGEILINGEFHPKEVLSVPDVEQVEEKEEEPLKDGKLRLEFVKGRDLKLRNIMRKPNSFLRMSCYDQVFSSSIVKNSSNPEWKYSLEVLTSDLQSNVMKLEVLDIDDQGKEDVIGDSEEITADHLKELKYTENVVNESLRYYFKLRKNFN